MFDRHYIPMVESTNDWMKKELEFQRIKHNYLIFTQNQTKGRGQFERTWDMKPGLDLAFSFFIHPENILTTYSPAVHSMSVCLALHQTFVRFGVNTRIKWPNDLIVHDKKISGILIESVYQNRHFYVINGIGVNLNSERCEHAESFSSISVKDVLKREVNPEKFIESFEDCFAQLYNSQSIKGQSVVSDMYHEYLYKRGETVQLQLRQYNSLLTCKISHVDEAGRLVVSHRDSLERYHHGEVKWML